MIYLILLAAIPVNHRPRQKQNRMGIEKGGVAKFTQRQKQLSNYQLPRTPFKLNELTKKETVAKDFVRDMHKALEEVHKTMINDFRPILDYKIDNNLPFTFAERYIDISLRVWNSNTAKTTKELREIAPNMFFRFLKDSVASLKEKPENRNDRDIMFLRDIQFLRKEANVLYESIFKDINLTELKSIYKHKILTKSRFPTVELYSKSQNSIQNREFTAKERNIFIGIHHLREAKLPLTTQELLLLVAGSVRGFTKEFYTLGTPDSIPVNK